jgi:hypothetical protein
MENQQLNSHQVLPYSMGILVLGILSIATCVCCGFPGLILGIIALILASTSMKTYKVSPHSYSISSYKNLEAGRICAIIGVSLSSLFILGIIVYYGILFYIASFQWAEMMNQY